MKKKILILCILAILLASIAVVSADSIDDHEDKGIKYNIPNGYSFSESQAVDKVALGGAGNNGMNYDYTNGPDKVRVGIFDLADPSMTIEDIKGYFGPDIKPKTVGDINGYITKTPSPNYYFYFVQNGKYVFINAPSEAIIEEMLK